MYKPAARTITFLSFLLFITGSSFSAVESPFEVGTWANFCQGAVSHTFDDNTAGQTGTAQPMFDAKGFHMTLFTVTGSMNPNWAKMKTAFAKGHEIASHSVTHAQTMPDAECPTSQATIRQQVPGEPCITIAYPNCNVPNPQNELKRCYIAGRICNGQIEKKTPSDFYRIGAIMGGSAGTNSASGFNSKANEAASSGGWLVWCHHGVGNDGHGYSNTATDALQGNIDFLDQNRNKIWTETFGNVARYIKERDAVSLTVKSSDNQSITVSVTDNLPDSIYNYPLTFRRPLPDGWTKAVVTQNATPVEDTIVTVNGKQYVMFQAVPDSGDVLLSSGATSAGKRYGNNSAGTPVRIALSGNVLTIAGIPASSGPVAVCLFNLNGAMLAEYQLSGKTPQNRFPLDDITASACIVRITAGGISYSQRIVTGSSD
ncbi:MAG: polysaccharide deacetylase family protein [Chitinispirillaceae bacterium]|nr:polysaccharide deacetylase family protein [Chitinispirillaceae bacterium]